MLIKEFIEKFAESESLVRFGVWDYVTGQPVMEGSLQEILESEFSKKELKEVEISWPYRKLWLFIDN